MKKHLKFYLLPLLFIFSSCEKSLYEETLSQKTDIKKNFISLDELKTNYKAFNKYAEINKEQEVLRTKKANLSERLVFNSNYGFYIDTDKILHLEKEGYESYTFSIYRDDDNSEVENLILSIKNNGETKAYLSSYNLTDEEKAKLKNEEVILNLDLKTSIEEIDGEVIVSNGQSNKEIYLGNDGNCYSIVI